jgi:transcription-repair coupling factor (superfamily II helicase)
MKSLFNTIHIPLENELLHQKEVFSHLNIAQEAILLVDSFIKHPRPMLIIKPNLYQAQLLYERVSIFLNDEVVLYSQEDSLRVEEIAQSFQNQSEKIRTLIKVIQNETLMVISHVGAVTRKIPDKNILKSHVLSLQLNQTISMDQLEEHLIKVGYVKTQRVDQPLTYARRGYIIDFYDLNQDHPVRLEFFGDEIDSIRLFDLHSQKTISHINQVDVYFASETLMSEYDWKKLEKLIHNTSMSSKTFKYMTSWIEEVKTFGFKPKDYPLFACATPKKSLVDMFINQHVIISPYEQVIENVQKNIHENTEFLVEKHAMDEWILDVDILLDYIDLERKTKLHAFKEFEDQSNAYLGVHTLDIGQSLLEHRLSTLGKLYPGYTMVFMVENHHFQDIEHVIKNQDIELSSFSFQPIALKEGLVFESSKVVWISVKELFNTTPTLGKFINRFKEAETIQTIEELKDGDYVVHQHHGIGIYRGIVTKDVFGYHKDFIYIEYRDESVLNIPIEQFRLIRKFIAMDGIRPKINKLGSSEWKKTKDKVKQNVSNIAQHLIGLYQLREQNIGHAYSQDTEEQNLFEQDFEFELTEDQKQAVIDIKKDMELPKPMDRLLCGDVGFGKTEVAAIAAFKAIQDHKQVAFLCPTTVLSFQHMKTFVNRFKNFAINVKVVNRFVSANEIQNILDDLKHHRIDILIGTHRLLSKDVEFKDLGLLIIDEEQRFGVEHKERIKQLKLGVDVLSLSATPIPRTLQMSLIGIRQLSQLNTPPKNRMPIQTYVVKKNIGLIKEIIDKELSRHGQVFYLHNQVETIYSVASRLQQLCPQASFAVAHGQMDKDHIEDVMIRFNRNEVDVLVCTTIIETGIDIPNANTMIVDQADRFGLSQLYQIRGRVGRSDRLAYTYLMYEGQKNLTEIASKRLQAIKEFTQLGSGYKIAMRDLTIRGAGDLLGDQQSGFINTVGMDMYVDLLKEAIAEQMNEPVKEEVSVSHFDVAVDAYIPKSYATHDGEKIHIVQTLQSITSLQALSEYEHQIQDQYGHYPIHVAYMFEKKRLEIFLNDDSVDTFKEKTNHVEIAFAPSLSSHIDGVQLFKQIFGLNPDIKLSYIKNRITLTIPKHDEWLKELIDAIKVVKEVSRAH